MKGNSTHFGVYLFFALIGQRESLNNLRILLLLLLLLKTIEYQDLSYVFILFKENVMRLFLYLQIYVDAWICNIKISLWLCTDTLLIFCLLFRGH